MFSGSSLTLSYTNFIVLRIYAEALDRLRVRLNMYLVIQESHNSNLGGAVVGRRTRDRKVAGSTPGRALSSQLGQLSLPSLRDR